MKFIIQSLSAAAFIFASLPAMCAGEVEEVQVYGQKTTTSTSFQYTSGVVDNSWRNQYESNMSRMYTQRAVVENCKANKASITWKFDSCLVTEANNYSASVLGCPTETNITTAVSPLVGVISVSTSPRNTCMENLKVSYDAAKLNCSKNSGLMQCKSYGAF